MLEQSAAAVNYAITVSLQALTHSVLAVACNTVCFGPVVG